jgi:hypothetical protein
MGIPGQLGCARRAMLPSSFARMHNHAQARFFNRLARLATSAVLLPRCTRNVLLLTSRSRRLVQSFSFALYMPSSGSAIQ